MSKKPMIKSPVIEKIIRFVGDPIYARKRRQGFIALVLLTVVADFLVTREHGIFFWDALFWKELPGWNAFFGLLSCLLIILVAKFLGHRCGLMQREDYYDD